jgi:hypothetical protein
MYICIYAEWQTEGAFQRNKNFVGPVRLAHLIKTDNRYWRTCDDHQLCHMVLHHVTSCENWLRLKLDTPLSLSTPMSTLSKKHTPSSLDIPSAATSPLATTMLLTSSSSSTPSSTVALFCCCQRTALDSSPCHKVVSRKDFA